MAPCFTFRKPCPYVFCSELSRLNVFMQHRLSFKSKGSLNIYCCCSNVFSTGNCGVSLKMLCFVPKWESVISGKLPASLVFSILPPVLLLCLFLAPFFSQPVSAHMATSMKPPKSMRLHGKLLAVRMPSLVEQEVRYVEKASKIPHTLGPVRIESRCHREKIYIWKGVFDLSQRVNWDLHSRGFIKVACFS